MDLLIKRGRNVKVPANFWRGAGSEWGIGPGSRKKYESWASMGKGNTGVKEEWAFT